MSKKNNVIFNILVRSSCCNMRLKQIFSYRVSKFRFHLFEDMSMYKISAKFHIDCKFFMLQQDRFFYVIINQNLIYKILFKTIRQ